MGKKKRSFSRGSSGGKLMNGLYKPTGILASVALGLGAAALASKIPLNVPYKQEGAAFIAGGLPGAAAVFLLKGMNGSSMGNDSDLVTGY